MSNSFMNVRVLPVAVLAMLAAIAMPAYAVDWNGVPSKEVTLFYPGQASWEFVLIPSTHHGAKSLRGGKRCLDCHEGEEADIGKEIVAGGDGLEPDPIKGKSGSIPVNVAFAHDADTLYVRFQWKDTGDSTGAKGDYQEHVTMMLGEQKMKEASLAGCWGTCHNDVKGMPDSADLDKYLPESRVKLSRTGGGTNYKSADELKALMGEGEFMEFWQAKLNKEGPVVGSDGYILEKFHVNDKPVVNSEGSFKDGTWTVVLSRKLDVSGDGHHKLVAGQVYPIGFAIHDDFAADRHHHVSFGYTFAIDQGDADFIAVKR